MKSVWNSFKAAFAMFSKIPTPMVDWNKENMKYMMCFFPFVGTAIGILTWLVGYVLGSHVQMEPFFLAVILTVIPVFVTGGIHVDGLLDTSDALSSWQERTRRLEILMQGHLPLSQPAFILFCGWVLGDSCLVITMESVS